MRGGRGRPDLLVVSHPAVVGVNQAVYAELARRGWDVGLVTPARWRHDYASSPVRAETLPALAGRHRRLPTVGQPRPQRHVYLASAHLELARLRPRALFCEAEPFSLAASQWSRAAWRLGIPFGVQQAENRDRVLPAPVRALRRQVLERASFVAARSPAAAALARRWGASGRVEVVPHHVPEFGAPGPRAGEGFRVGYVGRLVPEKGLDTLVEAVSMLGAGTELVVAGDGPLREWLLARRLGAATLGYLGPVPHDRVDEVLSGLDVLVLPSRTTPAWAEQFGRVLVEALWCGVPVVGSDSGEIPWVVSTTGGGATFPEGDAAALAAILKEWRGDPGLRARLAARGRAEAARRFTPGAVATAFEEVLAPLVPGRRPTPAEGRRPRVALVAHSIHDQGGMERACAELLRRGRGQVDFVVVAGELDPGLRPLVSEWVKVPIPARPAPLRFSAFYLGAALALSRVRVDLVHTVGAIVPSRVDLASVHHCHAGFVAKEGSLAPRPALPARRANTALARWLALRAESWSYRPGRTRCLAAVSDGVAGELGRHYPGVPAEVTPNGVDRERFRPDGAARRDLRAEAAAGEEAVVALFVGGDWDHKGLGLAIEALARGRGEHPGLVLWVVGEGPRARFEGLAARLGVDGAVRFWGRRADTERFFQAADLFVLPSAYETFSLVAHEAAACGLPLVVTGVNGAAELVGRDEAGIVVERDPAAIARALGRLSADPALRRGMGERARERVAPFTWDRSARSVLALYDSLLGAGGGVR